jgi:hypothetical protein
MDNDAIIHHGISGISGVGGGVDVGTGVGLTAGEVEGNGVGVG